MLIIALLSSPSGKREQCRSPINICVNLLARTTCHRGAFFPQFSKGFAASANRAAAAAGGFGAAARARRAAVGGLGAKGGGFGASRRRRGAAAESFGATGDGFGATGGNVGGERLAADARVGDASRRDADVRMVR